jgi:hypothetical protein
MSLSVMRCALRHVESFIAVFHRTLDLTRTAPYVRILLVFRVLPRVLTTQNPPTMPLQYHAKADALYAL